MKNRDDSPIGTEKEYQVSLPLAAVEALCNERFFGALAGVINKRAVLESALRICGENPPDWVIAGLNCAKDEDILPICIHSFLMDWRP